ncbi:PaaI family thioesterase [Allopusillimonas soli]|uniref:PaaI family thioesterase n=1 Tax=Allopusillimonas soli TaxID=659016 RepID=A0A853FAJ0_9BURK|nr:PaaI family thioesterase [Allopusillimonas soli]NYT37734.1 PaaI family thioesterase [Allopusillimonas soli]TEA74323.1 PaaI family thioesterase [Allopusillimonas soli]
MTTSSPTAPDPAITVEGFQALLLSHHPFAAVLGADIMEIGHGTATLRLPERDTHQRLGGMIAGPMLMGLADLALYAAVVGATGNADAVTASLTMNFLRKTPPGGVLAHARILKTGRLAAGEVLLTPASGGDPVAQAISTWALPARG